MSILPSSTKANAGILTTIVAIVNTVGAAWAIPPLTIPENAEMAGIIASVMLWIINLAVLYMPTFISVFMGKKYIDSKTDQNIAGIKAGTAVVNGQVVKVEAATPSNVNYTGVVTEQPTAPKQATKTFNAAIFSQEVEELAKGIYFDANDITRYFSANDHGRNVTWATKEDAVSYYSYLVRLALKAFEAKFGFALRDADKHLADDVGKPGACAYDDIDTMARQRGIDFWRMLLMVRSTIEQANTLTQ